MYPTLDTYTNKYPNLMTWPLAIGKSLGPHPFPQNQPSPTRGNNGFPWPCFANPMSLQLWLRWTVYYSCQPRFGVISRSQIGYTLYWHALSCNFVWEFLFIAILFWKNTCYVGYAFDFSWVVIFNQTHGPYMHNKSYGVNK